MKITVLTFGQITDITSQSAIYFTDVKDSEVLQEQLLSKFPALSQLNFSIAVNKKIIHQKTTFNENDTVALLPAFSGG